MNSRTVRELGGEIWAEMHNESWRCGVGNTNPFNDITQETENALLDLIMQVLARHDGERIVNDKDLPVVQKNFEFGGHNT